VTKYVSVDDGVTWEDANSPTGPYVLVGDDVLFKFIVTNSGDVTLTNITLTDNVYDLSGCTLTDPLPAGESFECVIGPFPAQSGQQTDTATATGDYSGTTYSDTNDANYFGADPRISIVKSTNGDDANSAPGPYILVGDAVTWTYTVTNTGNVPLGSINVTDDQPGVTPAYVSGDTNTDGLLDLTETWIYTASGTAVVGQYENTGTATGTPPGGLEPVTASDLGHYLGQPAPTTTVTLLNPLGPIIVGQTVQDKVTISTTATGALPAAGGTWTVEASQDVTFASGVLLVQTGGVSGLLPFSVTTNAWALPSAGTWYFRATYSGDSNYIGSMSNPLDETLIVKYWAFTPGFWKNNTKDSKNSHDAWKYTQYSTGQTLGEIFGAAAPCLYNTKPEKIKGNKTFAEYTLLQALSFQGGTTISGKMEILLRELVASLLNASFHETMLTPTGVYPYSSAYVIGTLSPVLCSGDANQIIALYTQLNAINNGIHYIDWSWTVGDTHPLP